MADNNTKPTLPQGDDVTPGGGEPAVTPPVDTGLKDKINETLGKEFKDEETALKAIKDTFAHVGDVGKLDTLKGVMGELQRIHNTNEEGVLEILKAQTVPSSPEPNDQTPPPSGDFVPRKEYDENQFYADNPDLKVHKGIIEAFRSKPENQGKSISDLINPEGEHKDAELITALTNAKTQVETENSKSVLHSNPRLGQASDKISKAKAQAAEGNQEAAEAGAVEAVVDAFGV